MKTILFSLLLSCSSAMIQAHQNSTAYIDFHLGRENLEGRWDVSIRDLEFLIGLDGNGDGEVTWGEIRVRIPEIQREMLAHLALRASDGLLPITPRQVLIDQRATGPVLVLLWQAPRRPISSLYLHYSFLFDYDSGHQCIVAASGSTQVLTRDNRDARFENQWTPRRFLGFVRSGVTHIFEGVDHLCFLLALMLPAVWRRTNRGWESIGSFGSAIKAVLRIVTAFTIAHSITLSAAALNVVVLPSALVESLIALSVIVAALNNLWPLWSERSWAVAFGFGLVHGFGFASALAGLSTSAAGSVASLAGFNLGVELGQLCVVLAFLPLAFITRDSLFYRRVVFRFGSVGIAGIAAVWLFERTFGVAVF